MVYVLYQKSLNNTSKKEKNEKHLDSTAWLPHVDNNTR